MHKYRKSIVLLAQDLRLQDNPAIQFAAQHSEQLALLYVLPDDMGSASKWWLHHSLARLDEEVSRLGNRLILRQGDPLTAITGLREEFAADLLVWNRVYTPRGIERGQALKQAMAEQGVACKSFNGEQLIEPARIATKQDTPFKVFTPFWRHCLAQMDPVEPRTLTHLPALSVDLSSDRLEDWQLTPSKPDWASEFAHHWQPGEEGAQQRWQAFLHAGIAHYKDGRDIPARAYTSRLSPHLAFGEISVRQLWHDTQAAMASGELSADNANKFLAELGWREFSRYLLFHFPHIVAQPFNAKFADFPWDNQPALLSAWQRGETGYPIVDAGMRELWQTGTMHNRVRMLVASFLTKHCLIHWQHGADWFWDTLLDADLANNSASWQWVAGCGADASPYFRIFNPTVQGERFDKNGEYVRRWVPELNNLPDKFIHQPWAASTDVLADAGISLGKEYPQPVVVHAEARERALQAYKLLTGKL